MFECLLIETLATDEDGEFIKIRRGYPPNRRFASPQILRRPGVTLFYYGWSYMLAWVGVAFSFLTGVLFLGSSHCLRREKDDEQAKNMQYLMPVSTSS